MQMKYMLALIHTKQNKLGVGFTSVSNFPENGSSN